ncbi:MAG TPA: hypothetical protein DCS24_03495 [Erythrobacter sp.]|nr:hypothetical protein [Erythrobacter sp.]
MASKALKLVVAALPLIFAIGFLAPVMAQGMIALGWSALAGLTPLQFGLIVAGIWGLVATVTGRWI